MPCADCGQCLVFSLCSRVTSYLGPGCSLSHSSNSAKHIPGTAKIFSDHRSACLFLEFWTLKFSQKLFILVNLLSKAFNFCECFCVGSIFFIHCLKLHKEGPFGQTATCRASAGDVPCAWPPVCLSCVSFGWSVIVRHWWLAGVKCSPSTLCE